MCGPLRRLVGNWPRSSALLLALWSGPRDSNPHGLVATRSWGACLPVPPGPVCWWLASRRGLEPRFPEPESGVLSVWTSGKYLGRMSLSRGTPGLGTHMQTLGSFHEDEVSSLYDRDLAYPLVILEPCDLRHSGVSCHGALREVDDEVWALPLLPDHRLGDLVRVR
jgi:hypothetical protein